MCLLTGKFREQGDFTARAAGMPDIPRVHLPHPVAGIGLESIVSSPTEGSVGHAFAGTARVGLELAFPLRTAALAVGIDVHGHLPFAATESFPSDLEMMLGFGAYLDYRF